MQTDWNPEADHGHLYQMLGPNPQINTGQKSVTSDLYANGQPTGVKLEIRAGGPAIGYSTVSAEMYEDKSITLGYVSTDEAIEFSGKLPTTAVFAENNLSPFIVMWDPKTYPGGIHDQAARPGSCPSQEGRRLLLQPAPPTWTT